MSACCNSLFTAGLWAIAKRQLGSFLANPLGYIFILLFVLACTAITVVKEDFFHRNICDFGNLYVAAPWLLAMFIPLLGMNAWAAERDSGTEELLLTLPITLADAIIGKVLAIGAFFTMAMACNVSLLFSLGTLGDPDFGLLFANLLGWWFLGLALIPLALFASMLVTSPSIAAVLGILFCVAATSLVAGVFPGMDLLTPYANGSFALGSLLFFVAIATIGLAGCFFKQAARRWRGGQENAITAQVATVFAAIVLAVNLGRTADKLSVQADLSADRISSVGSESAQMARDLPSVATIRLFITRDDVLPPDLQARAREILIKADALQRASGGQVKLEIRRPENPYDTAGAEATEQFGLTVREQADPTAFGNSTVPVLMGAAITCAEQTQSIPFFEPGQSVEYELIRGLRAVARKASPRPSVTVTIFAAKGLAEGKQELLDEAKKWVADQAKATGLTASIVEVEDTLTEREGLTQRLIEWQKPVPPPAADEKKEGETPPPAPTTETISRTLIFGAVIASERRTVRVPWLGDGEIGSKIREAITKARIPQPVVGLLKTDLELTGGFDQASMQSRREWALISEWRKHYHIKEIEPNDLDVDAHDDVQVLLAVLPSSLTDEQVQKLFHWVWSGRPTIIMDDPHPLFAFNETRTILAPAADKPSKQPSMPGMPPQPNPEKKTGDHGMRGFLQAFAIDCDLRQVWWSTHNPSIQYDRLPPEFLWADRDRKAVADDSMVNGVEIVLLPTPGSFSVIENADLKVQPLLSMNQGLPYGSNPITDYYNDLNAPAQFIFPKMPEDKQRKPADSVLPRHFAARVSGTVKHAYGQGDIASGTASPKPVNLVFIADTDLLHSQFFDIAKMVGATKRSASKEQDGFDPVLSRLRNVQFLENVLDAQIGDELMLELRSRWAKERNLAAFDEVRAEKRSERLKQQNKLQQQIEDEIAELQKKAEEDLKKIQEEGRLTLNELGALQEKFNVQLNNRMTEKQSELKKQLVLIDSSQRNELRAVATRLRAMALLIPGVLIGALVLVVALIHIARERAQVPAARERRS